MYPAAGDLRQPHSGAFFEPNQELKASWPDVSSTRVPEYAMRCMLSWKFAYQTRACPPAVYWQAEESSRKEEEDTRRRLAKETDAWQKQAHASARKEAEERDEIAKREAREKVREAGHV